MLAGLTVVMTLLCQSGTELNARGESLLAEGNYAEALRVFRKAAEASPRLAVAFFNQARAMAQLRRNARWAAPRPSKKSVLDVAEEALKLDSSLRARAEAELPSVRTTFRGQRLLGRTPQKNAPEILQSLTWRARNGDRFHFLADGTVRHATPPPGKWTVDGTHVTVELDGVKQDGVLGDDGVLTLSRSGRLFSF